jgi:hypothetical protein
VFHQLFLWLKKLWNKLRCQHPKKVLVAVVTSITINAQAAFPGCFPYIPFTEKKLSSSAPIKYIEGPLGKHLFWWCEDGTSNGLLCSFGNDCSGVSASSTLSGINDVSDKNKLAFLQSVWSTNIKYDCDDQVTTNRTDWVGQICREHHSLYANYKDVWLAGVVWKTTIPTVKKVLDEQIFLYYDATYSGVTGFKTVDECFRYAQTDNTHTSFTCVTRTQIK